jgi:hypothetical protein
MALKWMAGGLLLLATVAYGETVSWQIAAAPGTHRREVLANGVKTYSPDDVKVQEHLRRRDGAVSWSKSLLLSDGFVVAARLRRERALDGFGLVVRRRGDVNGYGWNWFERVADSEFERPRAPGRVAVATTRTAEGEVLASVEFLEDVALLYLDDARRPPGAYSHEVVIRKGSVLTFAAAKGQAANEPILHEANVSR